MINFPIRYWYLLLYQVLTGANSYLSRSLKGTYHLDILSNSGHFLRGWFLSRVSEPRPVGHLPWGRPTCRSTCDSVDFFASCPFSLNHSGLADPTLPVCTLSDPTICYHSKTRCSPAKERAKMNSRYISYSTSTFL